MFLISSLAKRFRRTRNNFHLLTVKHSSRGHSEYRSPTDNGKIIEERKKTMKNKSYKKIPPDSGQ